MPRDKKHPVALIAAGLVALGLTIGAVGFVAATARANAVPHQAPGPFPTLPSPSPIPPAFDAGPPPALDASPYDSGFVSDAGR